METENLIKEKKRADLPLTAPTDGHGEHHPQSFISKYIFSQDHKIIARQFLITGIFWAVVGGLMSALFRLQLGWPGETFPFLENIFPYWFEGGTLRAEFYYALITMHGVILVFFVLTAGLSGTFANLLIPLQLGVRDMASPFLNMLSYWFFFMASIIIFISLFFTNRTRCRRMDYLSAIKCLAPGYSRLRYGNDTLAHWTGFIYYFSAACRIELYYYYYKHANQRYVNDANALINLGDIFYSYYWRTGFPGAFSCCLAIIF